MACIRVEEGVKRALLRPHKGCDMRLSTIWEFPKIRDTLFWGPYNKDPTI